MATNPRVRIGHCSPDAPSVDVHVDGEPAFENLAFKDLSDYASLPSGKHDVSIHPAGGGDAVLETSLRLRDDTMYTALATGMLDDLEVTAFEDEAGDIPDDMAHVRFIHASPDGPSVSIKPRGGDDIFTRVGFRKASKFEQVGAGTYDLDVHPAGKDDVVLGLDDIELSGGNAYTVIAVGQVADESLDAILIEEEAVTLAADD